MISSVLSFVSALSCQPLSFCHTPANPRCRPLWLLQHACRHLLPVTAAPLLSPHYQPLVATDVSPATNISLSYRATPAPLATQSSQPANHTNRRKKKTARGVNPTPLPTHVTPVPLATRADRGASVCVCVCVSPLRWSAPMPWSTALRWSTPLRWSTSLHLSTPFDTPRVPTTSTRHLAGARHFSSGSI